MNKKVYLAYRSNMDEETSMTESVDNFGVYVDRKKAIEKIKHESGFDSVQSINYAGKEENIIFVAKTNQLYVVEEVPFE